MSTFKTRLVIATTNLKKLEELRNLLEGLDLQLSYLRDFQGISEVEENGKTFEANAEAKALGYAEQTGFLTLGEDSGLCCEALEGAPGIFSARFSGEDRSDDKNNEKILRLLKVLPDNCRGAHYTCVAALAVPGRIIKTFRGEVHGFISRELKGTNGFGYDPLFYYPPFKSTFGESTPEMKNQISHRAIALKKLRIFLEEYLAACADG